MNEQHPAMILADAVRERLAVVEAACDSLTSTVGPFPDPDVVYRQLAQMRTLKFGLLS